MVKKLWKSEQLEEIRQILETRLTHFESSVEETRTDLNANPGAMADPGDVAAHEFEQGFGVRLKEREQRLIGKIHAALNRISDDTYGICEECGEYIDLERLKARPVTTLCIDCKEDQEFLERLEMGH